MSNPDKSIDPRILASAREEFLSKPYEQVSLREICQKAGVTTGAFYNRYKNKEELFDALVAPTLETLKSYSDGIESFNYDHLDNQDMRKIWELTPETQRQTVEMLYDDYERFRLLLCHAEGTRYANFTTMFEPIIHGLPKENALRHSEAVAKLFNWTSVLGF